MDSDLLDAAKAGARSIRVRGWYGEECESAAVERMVRRPCLTTALAYQAGRAAALDELRRLSGYRRQDRATLVPLDVEIGTRNDDRYVEVEEILDLARRLRSSRLTPREREVVLLAAHGFNGVESAALMGVDPSRIVGLRRSARRKLAA